MLNNKWGNRGIPSKTIESVGFSLPHLTVYSGALPGQSRLFRPTFGAQHVKSLVWW